MPPEVYAPLIEEAHKHGILVHAHATNLQDQKGVVKAGVDVLVRTVANEKIDDELVALLKDHQRGSALTSARQHGAAWTDLIHRPRPRWDRRWDHSE